jgi:ribosome-binding factor A
MGRGNADRKTLQLCSQVADTLNYVLSGECDDELLQSLQVMSVVPAPNASQLLVTVYPYAAGGQSDAAEIRRHLTKAVGRLRSEVAASITRKKAPRLLFQVVHCT